MLIGSILIPSRSGTTDVPPAQEATAITFGGSDLYFNAEAYGRLVDPLELKQAAFEYSGFKSAKPLTLRDMFDQSGVPEPEKLEILHIQRIPRSAGTYCSAEYFFTYIEKEKLRKD